MMRYIVLIIMAISFNSCKEKEEGKIARVVKEWNGKIIQFPDSFCLEMYTKDTVIVKSKREQSTYTILNYVDTIGCLSCKLQLSRWKEMIDELDSIYPKKVNCLMVFNTNRKKQLIKLLRYYQFEHYVYMDDNDTLNKKNKFLNEENFHTFLLDKNDRIVAIGNPILRPRVKDLYYNIISDKTMITTSEDKQPVTVVNLSKYILDFENFSWNIEKSAEITVENVGKVPLIINDVITSCGCTTVDYTKSPVRPGGSTVLRINYKADHPEFFNKTVTVYCNAENSPLRLEIKGNAQ